MQRVCLPQTLSPGQQPLPTPSSRHPSLLAVPTCDGRSHYGARGKGNAAGPLNNLPFAGRGNGHEDTSGFICRSEKSMDHIGCFLPSPITFALPPFSPRGNRRLITIRAREPRSRITDLSAIREIAIARRDGVPAVTDN